MNEDYKIYMSDLAKRGPASLSDNLKYINDTVSHLEINRFNGAGDKDGYQIVCKAITMNVITGKRAYVVWAVQEGYESLEVVVQKAKDELKQRIAMGCPVLQEAVADKDIIQNLNERPSLSNLTEY